ncbi:MAG: SAM-dependent methyltransferase, partial [Bacteroidetes bacterium]
MSKFWDERYAPERYYYGKEPNAFFKSCIDNGKPGKILLPGDGEGRNSVYAARMGWE